MRHPLHALTLAAFLTCGPAARAADPVPGVTVMGGVADPPNKVVYLSDPAGSVVAVDIDTGAVRWESKDATRPVAALGTRVYALKPEKGQANAFRVVTLDATAKGKVVRRSDLITLPDWADVGDANDRFIPPKIFYCRTDLTDGALTVRWQGASRPRTQPGTYGFGEARVDLVTGKVATAPGEELPFPRPTHSDEVMRVIRKRNWGPGEPIAAAGGRVFGRVGGTKGDARVLTVHVADLKTGDLLWERVTQEVRVAPEK